MGIETALIIGAATAVIGAGVSAYSSYQQGQTQKAVMAFNARAQEANTRAQVLSLQAQAALKNQEAQANFQLRSAEAQARLANAKAIEQNALTQDRINAANLAKRREQFARMQAGQRATIAASGAVESSGTPLDLLAETAARIQQDQEEQQYTNELQRRTLFAEAAQERLGGQLAMAGATLDRDSSLAAVSLQNASAEGARASGFREAQIMRLTGNAAARAGTLQAGATLLTAAGNAAGSVYRPTYKPS